MEKDALPVARVTKLISGGEGLARWQDKALFLAGALPGEEVRFEVTEEKSGFRRGRVVEILTRSPDRRDPGCTHYGQCGGCDFQHLSLAAQGTAKASIVQESFARLGKLTIDRPEVVQGQGWGYRNRLQIHGSPAAAGFKARASDQRLKIDCCPVADAGFSEVFSHPGQYFDREGRFLAFSAQGQLWVEGRQTEAAVQVAGKTIRFPLKGFFQSNLEVLELLLPFALDGLSGDHALDLYCGVGLFGAFLADRFKTVHLVEENALALDLARKNLPPGPHKFHSETLEAWTRRRQVPNVLDAAVVDPPRTGLSAQVVDWLIAKRPKKLVYVSCNPDTMARDCGLLVRAGWSLKALKVFDFYPQTSHIEACARLEPPQ